MKNEKKVKVEGMKVKNERMIKIDEDYLFVVEECIKKGLIGDLGKEKYESVGYVWENRSRVIGRSNRDGLRELKFKVLEEKGISKEEVIKFEEELKKRGGENYLSIRV